MFRSLEGIQPQDFRGIPRAMDEAMDTLVPSHLHLKRGKKLPRFARDHLSLDGLI